ncbi:MAG: helix-turn-helix domain-containing protein [Candidatus Thiodiazotropha lotti]|uniref:Helix-turn-helix domain-containing protein n=1 Tax=Candidatus Thiodiazotropha lotti TaxID=2792787 RepID=A0A9E4K476_9GAMM|nr:helix-turn-helix domain-containing protein [Candidatus Thiodiazotropha lotti]MCG7931713.1 helix-turn-helix domain-containing protein [Candidatus Thiodiazotropha lotti]MCG7938396.1 helix-turn-helix domain-containing protein [Candidatus Thiodiazotropha lotti]MCG7985790.1 helix-turn-helix domain-containing protein [Candidatus Thiodiazotropha lotti]MCG8002190.1 helix-turn-helix domain-containing protein [Candidatus Thiodiazotropha lotti]
MKTFIATEGREAATRLAAKCGTKYIYLTQIASGFRKPSGRLTLLLERHSGAILSRHELRPDLYPKEQSEQQKPKRST